MERNRARVGELADGIQEKSLAWPSSSSKLAKPTGYLGFLGYLLLNQALCEWGKRGIRILARLDVGWGVPAAIERAFMTRSLTMCAWVAMMIVIIFGSPELNWVTPDTRDQIQRQADAALLG